jgi:hypothetical protein
MNYDPNLTNSGRMAIQVVRLTFGMWESRKTVDTTVGGNCNGLQIIDNAVGRIYDELPDRFDCPYIILDSPNGDTLECSDDEEKGEDWLKDMLIAAEIISIEPKPRKANP